MDGYYAWMVVATALVLMMTVPALALFYGGMTRSKSVLNMMMLSFVALFLAAEAFAATAAYDAAIAGWFGHVDQRQLFPEALPIVLKRRAELRYGENPHQQAAFYAGHHAAGIGRAEQVPAGRAAGRVAAEMLTPYPPGIPVAMPGRSGNHLISVDTGEM